MLETVDDCIEALGGTGVVADALGLPLSTVSSWRNRKSIPGDRWLGIIELAEGRGVSSVTFDCLALLHARRAEARA